MAGYSLDQPEHEVTLAEREGLDLFAVVVAQFLLVDGRPTKSQQALLLEEIDAVVARDPGFRLRVSGRGAPLAATRGRSGRPQLLETTGFSQAKTT
jgi:hypothetical protein